MPLADIPETRGPRRGPFWKARCAQRSKIGIDAGGRLWLLWGEPAPGTRATSRLEWMIQPIESVWGAMYDPTRREWSVPEQLVKASAGSGAFAWSQSVPDPSPLPGWELGTTVVLTTMHASAGGELRSAVARLRLRDGRWHTELVPLPGPAAHVSIAVLGSTTVLAYVGSAEANRPQNHVVTMRSSDDGKTWTAPSVLDSAPGISPVQAPMVLPGPTAFHLLWKHVRPDRTRGVRHRASADGVTWSEPNDLSLPRKTGGETIGVDRCEHVHIVYEVLSSPETLDLTHAVFSTTWSAPTVLFPTMFAYAAHFSAHMGGHLLMSYVAVARDAPPGTTHRTYVAELSPQ